MMEEKELFKEFYGILSELTPQNFLSSVEQALKLDINTEERLRGCVDQIFSKVDRGGGSGVVKNEWSFHFLIPFLRSSLRSWKSQTPL